MDESKTKVFIQLLISHYYTVRDGDDTTNTTAAIANFLKENPNMENISGELWQTIGNVFARGTPEEPVHFIYNKFEEATK